MGITSDHSQESLESHKLLDHPENFRKRKLSLIPDFADFYEKSKRKKLCKHSKAMTPLKLIFSKRQNTVSTILQASINPCYPYTLNNI